MAAWYWPAALSPPAFSDPVVGGHFGIEAGFRVLGRRPGKPFAAVCVSPDGKRPLARRPDGFYALPAGGGTPAEAFDDLPAVTVLRWSGR